MFLLLLACTAPQAPAGAAGPVEAVQEFAAAMQKGDSAAAWALLSKRTQQEAGRLALAADPSLGPDAGAEAGRQMLFQSALPDRPIEAKVVSQTAETAEVLGQSDAGSHGWHVVRETGAAGTALWRVDLELPR